MVCVVAFFDHEIGYATREVVDSVLRANSVWLVQRRPPHCPKGFDVTGGASTDLVNFGTRLLQLHSLLPIWTKHRVHEAERYKRRSRADLEMLVCCTVETQGKVTEHHGGRSIQYRLTGGIRGTEGGTIAIKNVYYETIVPSQRF